MGLLGVLPPKKVLLRSMLLVLPDPRPEIPFPVQVFFSWGKGQVEAVSYAAFISLAELGGSCNKPLSTLPFSYGFMKASRLSRSGPSSTSQSDLLVCLL